MKISKYTFFIKEGSNYCIYNSLTNSLIDVGEEIYKSLELLQKSGEFEVADLFDDQETIDVLTKGKILTENDQDDLLSLKAIILGQRNSKGVYNLTIAPTLDCNYNCYYCFEEHQKRYMDEHDVRAIKNYIDKQEHIRSLHVTWFGGEPLMAFEIIEKIYSHIKLKEKTTYSSSLITNAYYMTPDIVDKLESLGISRIQISIDGIHDAYNHVKNMPDNKQCFDRLVKNMDYLVEKTKLTVNIRVNLSNDNMDAFFDSFRFFKKRYPDCSHLFIIPAFLQTNQVTESIGKKEHLIEKSRQAEFLIDVHKKGWAWNMIYPRNNFNECAVRNYNSWGFAPGGDLYKCWESIGNKEVCLGKLNEDGTIEIHNPILLNRYLYGEDPLCDAKCQHCSYYPICFGGCPYSRIRNFYEKANIDVCAKQKDFLSAFIGQKIKDYQNKNQTT